MNNKIILNRIKSSNIDAIGYDNENKELYIMYRGISLYKYYPINEELYKKLEEAESKGKFLHKFIKYNAAYKFEQINYEKLKEKFEIK